MAFSDPQKITIGTSDVSLPATGGTGNSTIYTSNDQRNTLTVSHALSKNKRFRRVVRSDFNKVAPNPFQTSLNAQYSMAAYTVFDVPTVGYDVAEQAENIRAHLKWLATPGVIEKVLGGES